MGYAVGQLRLTDRATDGMHEHHDAITTYRFSARNGQALVEHIECNHILRVNGTRGECGQLRIETEQLRRELVETRTRASVAEQRMADLTAMLNDIREQRDRWQAQADRLGSVLTDQERRAPRWWPWRRQKRDDTRLQITHMRDNPSDLKKC
jgi:hypothetical protein